jgi:hypothetical protein
MHFLHVGEHLLRKVRWAHRREQLDLPIIIEEQEWTLAAAMASALA